MKKLFPLITVLILFSLTGCQNTPDANKSSVIDQNKTASKIVNNDLANNTPNSNIKNTSFDMGGLQVQGMMDIDALEKAKTESQKNGIIANKRGLIIDQNGFNPNSLQASSGMDLLIYNNSAETITISSNNVTTACKDFGDKLTLASKQTQTIKLATIEQCTLSNSKNPDQKAVILVK